MYYSKTVSQNNLTQYVFKTTFYLKTAFCFEWEKANPELAAEIDGAVFVADSTHLGFGVLTQHFHVNKFLF